MTSDIKSLCATHPQAQAEDGTNGGFPHVHCMVCQQSLIAHINAIEQSNKLLQDGDKSWRVIVQNVNNDYAQLAAANEMLKAKLDSIRDLL